MTQTIKKREILNTHKNLRKCVLKEMREKSALKERRSGDFEQMVQFRSKSELDSWQQAWTESQWTQSFWKATRRLDQRARTDPQPRDTETNCPQGPRLLAGQQERRKLPLSSLSCWAGAPGLPRLLKSPAEAGQQRHGKRCDTWPNRRGSDYTWFWTVTDLRHDVILNYSWEASEPLIYGHSPTRLICKRLFQPSCRKHSLAEHSETLAPSARTNVSQQNDIRCNADNNAWFNRTLTSFPQRWI